MDFGSSRTLIVVLALAVLITAAGLITARLASEPRPKGKTLFELISVAASTRSERTVRRISNDEARDALAAVRGMGTELDRFLIKALQAQDNSWRSNYQSFYKSAFAQPFRRYLSRPVSGVALRQLGVRAIGKTGRMSPRIERMLITACQDSDLLVRGEAAMILGYKGSRSPEVTGALTRAVQDPQVAQIIGQGPRHSAFEFDLAGKNLHEMIADLDRPLPAARYEAAYALRGLGSNAAPAIPALLRLLNQSEQPIRIACVRALGAVGPLACNALPALQKLCREEDSTLARSTINEAIAQIESQTTR